MRALVVSGGRGLANQTYQTQQGIMHSIITEIISHSSK